MLAFSPLLEINVFFIGSGQHMLHNEPICDIHVDPACALFMYIIYVWHTLGAESRVQMPHALHEHMFMIYARVAAVL